MSNCKKHYSCPHAKLMDPFLINHDFIVCMTTKVHLPINSTSDITYPNFQNIKLLYMFCHIEEKFHIHDLSFLSNVSNNTHVITFYQMFPT